ncbi:kinase-like domain-containing protein [Fennellomyces sp. T-0311]|nr:kinase-like domain-containing protein [Fennellomyces sp. T-0311]
MVEDVKPMEPFTLYRRQPQGRRSHARQIKLGPYLLLQTLGEGEFGKVKLGIHTETGQEFAVKLIRKETVGYSPSRLNKVEREIHALRTLKHPYIVKLFNVIETEKYIGIILEYASGGELFEHIVAHRCLKEKDARRLFAQLISSVQYMHRQKIVHRDLKLENLLLDRNRNIVVTDFGFANNKEDDLMATSCGSPCYAAPELVVNEGLYAGSAVDIWSCGVILYAMLCGYLPFDDDPCNPDSNNINQLYRYILSTPPTFPHHVSSEAQDLLRQILVADPEKRCTLDTIQQHPWLEPYHQLFDKSDDELEAEAAAMAEQSFMPNYRKMAWSTETKDETKDTTVRPATVHGAMRRININRTHQTTADRSRKARTAIEQKTLQMRQPLRRERLLSFFTGKTDQEYPDETLPVSKLRSKFIASLRVRRKDGPTRPTLQQNFHDENNTSSISSISATTGTQQPQPQQQEQLEDEAIAINRQETLHTLTRGQSRRQRQRGQRQRYYSTLGGQSGRRAIDAVRNSIYRKNTTAADTKPSGEDGPAAWPPQRHSIDAGALIGLTQQSSQQQAQPSPDPQPPSPVPQQPAVAQPAPQQQKSVSKKMMAWIKRKSQGM